MPVHPEGCFYQLNGDGSVNEKTKIRFGQKLRDNDLTEQQLIYYATYELKMTYDLFLRHNIKTVSLRKPIHIQVTLRKLDYEFVCQSIPVNYVNKLLPTDLPFRLKKTLFAVFPKKREIQKAHEADKVITPSDLNRLFNAIDANMQKAFKSFSPIIYTGMTN